MTDKTPVDLDRLDALEKDVPAMPWEVRNRGDYWEVTFPPFGMDTAFDDGSAGGEYGSACSIETRDFLLTLRNAYPAMAEELRRLRARVAELEGK